MLLDRAVLFAYKCKKVMTGDFAAVRSGWRTLGLPDSGGLDFVPMRMRWSDQKADKPATAD